MDELSWSFLFADDNALVAKTTSDVERQVIENKMLRWAGVTLFDKILNLHLYGSFGIGETWKRRWISDS